MNYISNLVSTLSYFGLVEREVSFDDLLSDSKRKLRFDFRLNYKESEILIELDGWSHFDKDRALKEFHLSEKEFLKARIYDRRKELYCKKNKLFLLRLNSNEPWTIEHLKYRLENIIQGVKDEFYYDFSQYD